MKQLTAPSGDRSPTGPAALAPPVPSGGAAAWRTLTVASLAILATFMDATILFVAFEDIGRSFPTVSAPTLAWVLNGYTITFAALLVPAGKLSDRVGHKRAFLVGSGLFTLASVACAVAPAAGVLVAFRVVQAMGAALLVPSSLALVLRAFPREQIPVAVAVWGAMGAVAGALGPTLGATLVEFADWRWAFLINVPVGLVTVVAGLRVLNESRDPTSRVPSLVGVVLIAAAAGLASLALLQADSWGWLDRRTAAAFLGGMALLAVFVAHQRRTRAPALDLELFALHNYRWANAAALTFGVAFTAMFFGSILFLTNVWGWSILQAGLGVSPGPLLVAATAPTFGRIAARTGQRPLLLIGGVLFATSGVWRLLVLDGEPSYVTDYLPSILFSGLGVAMTVPQHASVVAQSLPPNRLGVGGAANQALRQFGGTFGVALTIGFLGQPASLEQALTRFDQVWWLLVAGGLLSALLASRLRTRPVALDVAPPEADAPAIAVEVGDGAIDLAEVGSRLQVLEPTSSGTVDAN